MARKNIISAMTGRGRIPTRKYVCICGRLTGYRLDHGGSSGSSLLVRLWAFLARYLHPFNWVAALCLSRMGRMMHHLMPPRLFPGGLSEHQLRIELER